MFLGLLILGLRLLLEMLNVLEMFNVNVGSFPSIYNDVVDGIPESYVHYYKKYLYEIEFVRREAIFSIPLRSCNFPVAEKEKQLVINFKFDGK